MAPFTEQDQQRLLNILLRSEIGRKNAQGNSNTLQGKEGNKRLNSGFFGDLFSVLRRPAAASAGAALSLTGHDPTHADPLTAAWRGLTAQTDYNYSDVLGGLGVKGPLKSIGGFIGDVALDPLTYLSAGSAKGISAVDAAAQATKLATERSVPREIFGDAVTRLTTQLQDENPAHMWATFMGKKIPGTSNTVVPELFKKANVALLGPETKRRWLARAFSPQSELPFGLQRINRIYQSSEAADFAAHQQSINRAFGTLSQDQAELISRATSRGESLQGVLLEGDKANKFAQASGLRDLGDFQNLFRAHNKAWFDELVGVGLRKPEQYDPNYVYKYYKNPFPQAKPGLPPGTVSGGRGTSDFKALYKNMTLEDAITQGLQPELHAGEIMKLRAATHYRDMARFKFVRDAIEQFGVEGTKENIAHLMLSTKDRMKWFKVDPGINSKAAHIGEFENRWLPEPIANVLNATEETFSQSTTASQFMQTFDKVMGHWKFFNTGISPGYHVRNSVSDFIMNWADDVRNPLHYEQSARVLRDVADNNMKNFLTVGRDVPTREASTRMIKLGSHNVPTSDVWALYTKSGSKSGQIVQELGPALDPTARQGFGQWFNKNVENKSSQAMQGIGKAEDVVVNMGNKREDFFRMAHFIDGVNKEMAKNGSQTLEQAAMKVGDKVRKFNIDYGGLTDFEKKAMRRVIPFYTWMRKSLPLQAQLLFTKPGFMSLYPKGQDLIQGVLGADDGSSDTFIPKWIRDSAPVRLALGREGSRNGIQKLIATLAGAGPNDAVFAPIANTLTPIGELEKIGGPLNTAMDKGIWAGVRDAPSSILNASNPAIKDLAELTFGRSAFTQGKIKDWPSWLIGQVAPSRTIDQLAGGTDNQRMSALMSYVFGLRPQVATPARQEAEFRRRSDVINARNTAERNKVLEARGIDPNSAIGALKRGRINTPETRVLSRWNSLYQKQYSVAAKAAEERKQQRLQQQGL